MSTQTVWPHLYRPTQMVYEYRLKKISFALKKTVLCKSQKNNFVSKAKKKKKSKGISTLNFEYGYVLSSKTSLMLHASGIVLPHDVHLKTNLVTVCLSDNWTFILMRALLDSPVSSLSWSILVKVQRTNTGSLWVRFSVGPCPHVSLHQSKHGGGLYLLRFWNRHCGSIRWWYQSHTETCSCGG